MEQQTSPAYRKFLRQIRHPQWVLDPETWVWQNKQGVIQGPGRLAIDQPGIFNLSWLALRKKKPPHGYDGTSNYLMLWAMSSASAIKVGKLSLEEIAALYTEEEFCSMAKVCRNPEVHMLIKASKA